MPKTSSGIGATHPEHTAGPAQDIIPHGYPPTKPRSRKTPRTPCRLEKHGHSCPGHPAGCFPQLSKVRKRQRVLTCVHLVLTANLSPSRRSPQHWKEGKGLSSTISCAGKLHTSLQSCFHSKIHSGSSASLSRGNGQSLPVPIRREHSCVREATLSLCLQPSAFTSLCTETSKVSPHT